MRLGTEDFWCPGCGRLPQSECRATDTDEQGRGPYIPYYKLLCLKCGEAGKFVCRGTESYCDVVGTLCVYHACHVTDAPYPQGRDDVGRQARQIQQQRRSDDNEMGLWDGGASMDVRPARGGIF